MCVCVYMLINEVLGVGHFLARVCLYAVFLLCSAYSWRIALTTALDTGLPLWLIGSLACEPNLYLTTTPARFQLELGWICNLAACCLLTGLRLPDFEPALTPHDPACASSVYVAGVFFYLHMCCVFCVCVCVCQCACARVRARACLSQDKPAQTELLVCVCVQGEAGRET